MFIVKCPRASVGCTSTRSFSRLLGTSFNAFSQRSPWGSIRITARPAFMSWAIMLSMRVDLPVPVPPSM